MQSEQELDRGRLEERHKAFLFARQLQNPQYFLSRVPGDFQEKSTALTFLNSSVLLVSDETVLGPLFNVPINERLCDADFLSPSQHENSD